MTIFGQNANPAGFSSCVPVSGAMSHGLLYTVTVKLYIRVRPHAQALHKGEGYKGGTLHYRCIHILNIEARPQAPQYLWCSRGRSHMHLVALPRVPLRKAPEGGTELLARRVVAYR